MTLYIFKRKSKVNRLATILPAALVILGDFQESCHSCAAVQAACLNGSCPDSLSSSGG
jgi:hypothetical protein